MLWTMIRITLAGYVRSNSQAERNNTKIKETIREHASQHEGWWLDWLPKLLTGLIMVHARSHRCILFSITNKQETLFLGFTVNIN